jgi:hypothetical protein
MELVWEYKEMARDVPDTIKAGSDGPRLFDVLVQTGLHDHVCLVYDSQEEQLAMPVPSIRMALSVAKNVFSSPLKKPSAMSTKPCTQSVLMSMKL